MTEIALLNRNKDEQNFKLNIKLTSSDKQENAEVTSVAFHQSVPYLATGFINNKAKIWLNGTILYNLDGHTERVNSVAFHPKKFLIATGSADGTANLWIFQHHNRPRENNNIKPILTLTGHKSKVFSSVFSVAFYPKDDQIILATGSIDGTAKIWNISPNLSEATCITTLTTSLTTGNLLNKNFFKNWFNSVAFHPIHNILATGNSDTAKLWYLNGDFSLKKMLDLSEHTGPVRTVSFSPNGSYLATGSDDNKVILWKIESEGATLYTTLDGHTKAVRSVTFCSLDSQYNPDKALILATGSDDKSVKFWKILTGSSPKKECLVTLEKNKDSVTSVAVFKNSFLATGSSDGYTRTFSLNFENIRNNRGPLESNLIENRQNLIENRKNLIENRKNLIQYPNIPIPNSTRNNAEPLPITNEWDNYDKKNYYVITIPSKFSTPKNNSCPNFRDLYYSFMKTELPTKFIFIFEGQTGIDATGLSRIVFDTILKVYIELFFEKIENNNDFLILKEGINLRQLITDTKKLILLANAASAKICLKIDPELLELCKLGVTMGDLKEYFTNEKKQFEKFYKDISNAILNNTFNELNNSKVFLKNNNKNKNNIIKQYKEAPANSDLEESLKKEIRLRKFAVKCGFKSWQQLFNMCRFLALFSFYPDSNFNMQNSALDRELYQLYLKKKNEIFKKQEIKPDIPDFSFVDFFDFEPKFDEASILSRVKLIMSSPRKDFDIKDIPSELFRLYPALKPFVDYIIGPNSTDENRKKFVQFITGSKYSTDKIDIFLEDTEISSNRRSNGTSRFRLPFEPPSTCFSYIKLLKRPTSGNYKNDLTNSRINELILSAITTLTANNNVGYDAHSEIRNFQNQSHPQRRNNEVNEGSIRLVYDSYSGLFHTVRSMEA